MAPPPLLKTGTDFGVQEAWNNSQWNTVINKCKQMAKINPYYNAILLAARSMLDTPADQFAASEYVDKLVKSKKVELDPESIKLYEWACGNSGWDFTFIDTFGVLYSRLIKFLAPKPESFNEKSHLTIFMACFYECQWHQDWEHALDIITVVSNAMSGHHRFLFMRMVTTLLRSQHDRKNIVLWRFLLKKLVDPALSARDKTPEDERYPPKSFINEEEMLLWLAIQTGLDLPSSDVVKLLKEPEQDETGPKPDRSATKALKDGHHMLFKEIMKILEQNNEWDEIWKICRTVFRLGSQYAALDSKHRAAEQAVAEATAKDPDRTEKTAEEKLTELQALKKRNPGSLSKEEKTRIAELGVAVLQALKKRNPRNVSKEEKALIAELEEEERKRQLEEVKKKTVQDKKEAESGAFQQASLDAAVWDLYVAAANHRPNVKNAYKSIWKDVKRLLRARNKWMLKAFQRPIYMIDLENTFNKPRDGSSQKLHDMRISNLLDVAKLAHNRVFSFEDMKPYVEQLEWDDLTEFMRGMGTASSLASHTQVHNITIAALQLRFRYLIAGRKSNKIAIDRVPTCKTCKTPFEKYSDKCRECLLVITNQCLIFYNGVLDQDGLERELEQMDLDPCSDLCIIGATCLLKLAGVNDVAGEKTMSSLQSANMKLVLQAVAWLELRRQQTTAGRNIAIRVLLVKLYLMIGCVPEAELLWSTLQVKNVIIDSLGPLYADRLSTLSPGMWKDQLPVTPMTQALRYYGSAIQSSVPRNIREAFLSGSVNSVLGMTKFKNDLLESCSLIMTVVDDLRGLRAVGNKIPDIMTTPLLSKYRENRDFTYVDNTNWNALPNNEDASRPSVRHWLCIGPELSSERANLSLAAETFIDDLTHQCPKEFKSGKATTSKLEIDRRFLAQASLDHASHMTRQLSSRPNRSEFLSGPEMQYFDLVLQLCHITHIWATAALGKPGAPRADDGSDYLTQGIAAMLMEQVNDIFYVSPYADPERDLFYMFGSLHAHGMARESIVVAKRVVKYFKLVHEKTELAVPNWLTQDLQVLSNATTEAEKQFKDRLREMSDGATDKKLENRIMDWVFPKTARGGVEKVDPKDKQATLEATLYQTITNGWPGRLEQFGHDLSQSWKQVAEEWQKVKFD